jgi:hypothetical protein
VTAPHLSTEDTFYLEKLCNSSYYFGSYCSRIYGLLHILLLSAASEPGTHSLSDPRNLQEYTHMPNPVHVRDPQKQQTRGLFSRASWPSYPNYATFQKETVSATTEKWMSGDSCSRRFSMAERLKVDCASGQVPGVH